MIKKLKTCTAVQCSFTYWLNPGKISRTVCTINSGFDASQNTRQ